ncbi:MAG: YqaA family protein [Alistipes indistinctus]
MGNWLGGLTSYWLDGSANGSGSKNTCGSGTKRLSSYKSKVDRYGAWLALLTWLPFIGDIFAIALGFYRVDFRKSALLMLIGKGARFVMWALLFLWGKAHIF